MSSSRNKPTRTRNKGGIQGSFNNRGLMQDFAEANIKTPRVVQAFNNDNPIGRMNFNKFKFDGYCFRKDLVI